MTRTSFDIAFLSARLARLVPAKKASPQDIATAVSDLMGIAKRLHSLFECACNYGLTKRQEAREANLELAAHKGAESLGMICFIQRDPRGGTIYIAPKGSDPEAYNSHPWYFVA